MIRASVGVALERLRRSVSFHQFALDALAGEIQESDLAPLWASSRRLEQRYDEALEPHLADLGDLELLERTMTAQLGQLRSLLLLDHSESAQDVADAHALFLRAEAQILRRKEDLGVPFRSELQAHQRRVRRAEEQQIAGVLSGQVQLSDYEAAALASEGMEDLDQQVSSVQSQFRYLQVIQGGGGSLSLYTLHQAGTTQTDWVRDAPRALVAKTGERTEDHDLFSGGFTLSKCVPINREAVRIFGGTSERNVDDRNLQFVSVSDVLAWERNEDHAD